MAEVTLDLLFALVERVRESQVRIEIKLDRIADDLADLKLRTTSTEEGLAGVNRRLDRIDGRLDRLERRADIAEA